MKPLYVMDTTLRDAHQSLWATRMETKDMVPILPKLDKVGYWSLEMWGGATFDTCLRFRDEDPWQRLRIIKEKCPHTPLQMLTRGQNLVGYRHYSKDIVNRFIKVSHRNGIDIFRVFDALNDVNNVIDSAEAINECGAHFEGAISYTVSPVHTLESYVEYALALKDMGAKSISIKDMAGLLTPYNTERLVTALNKEVGLPVHVHCHYVGGMAIASYIKAAEAGAAIVDCASAPLAFGNSQPSVETLTACLADSDYDTGFDLDLLFEIADYWEGVREKCGQPRGIATTEHMHVFSHQVPGGMMSNLVSQLEIQHASDKLGDVLREIPRVRQEVGYPPLVTPMSQIVGTQAVFNVITGKRWSVVSKEMKDYVAGYYGKTPGEIAPEVRELILGTSAPLPEGPVHDELDDITYDDVAAEIGELAHSEEDVLSYAMFPNEARQYLEKHKDDTEEERRSLAASAAPATEEEDEDVEIAQIRELVKMVSESGIGELTVEGEGSRVCVRSEAAAVAAPYVAAAPLAPVPAAPAPAPAAAPAPEAAPAPAAAPAAKPDSWVEVTSPMVGTFYAAPSPDSDPFVQKGDVVEAGATLCIVEAMKLMNEIPAEVKCTVREVCVDNAEPVEFGTVMFYVEPVE